MNDKVYTRLKQEKDRPKTATLQDAQKHILPQIEDYFKKFWEVIFCALFVVASMFLWIKK